MLDRRSFAFLLAAAASAPGVAFANSGAPDPAVFVVRRKAAKTFLLGYWEAYDTSWFTPKVQDAVDQSAELWLETPPGSAASAATGAGSAPDDTIDKVIGERGFDRTRDLFTVLPPKLSERTLAWAKKLSIDPATLAPMRPWWARSAIQQAYGASKQKAAAPERKLVWPEATVIDRIRKRSAPIHSEYPSIPALFRFFADLPGEAQPQYLEEEIDYLDEDEAGLIAGTTDWISGRPDSHFLDQMRGRRPDLYRAMHVERNAAWADRIDGFLAEGRTRFVMIGQNHLLGPDSIQANLERRAIEVAKL